MQESFSAEARYHVARIALCWYTRLRGIMHPVQCCKSLNLHQRSEACVANVVTQRGSLLCGYLCASPDARLLSHGSCDSGRQQVDTALDFCPSASRGHPKVQVTHCHNSIKGVSWTGRSLKELEGQVTRILTWQWAQLSESLPQQTSEGPCNRGRHGSR